jgi:hypothetical protein
VRLKNLKKAEQFEEEVMTCGGKLTGDQIRIIQRTGTKYKRKVVWVEPTPADSSNGLIACELNLDIRGHNGLGHVEFHIKHCNNTGGTHYGMSVYVMKENFNPKFGNDWEETFEDLINDAKDGGYRNIGIPEEFGKPPFEHWENEIWATWIRAYEVMNKK